MRAQRDAKFESLINAVLIYFAHIVIDATGPEHRAGDAGIDGKLFWQHADALSASQENLIFGKQPLEFVEKLRKLLGDGPGLLDPTGRQLYTAPAEAHVIAHHSRAAERLEQIQDFFALAKCIHEGGAHCAHVLRE